MKQDHTKYSVVRDLGFSLLAEGKILKIKADGYSMYPSIKPGSVIFIEPLEENSSPVPGEIIAWKRESGFVVHRLVKIIMNENEILYFTRGDSCGYEDQPVTRDLIAGKVVLVENQNKETTEDHQLARRPCYFSNRLKVWFILKYKRVASVFNRPPAPLKGG
jgi:signal peptidase I